MARPVKPKKVSEHLATLTMMLRQVEIDEQLPPKRRERIGWRIGALMREFQREVPLLEEEMHT